MKTFRISPVLKVTVFLLASFVACTSAPTREAASQPPSWIGQPTRTVDSGYIVYVGKAEDPTAEHAKFKSEAIALEDVANECSFAPKGTRIEDRYEERTENGYRSYTKIGLQFEECEAAKKAIDPEAVRQLANVAMAQQIQRYQELYEREQLVQDESTHPGEAFPADPSGLGPLGTVNPPPQIAGANQPPVTVVVATTPVQYYWARNRVFIAKQNVILAPPTLYTPGSPETVRYVTVVKTESPRVATYERANPQVRSTPAAWSTTHEMRAYSRGGHTGAGGGAMTHPQNFSPHPSPSYSPSSSRPRGRHFGGGHHHR